MVSVRMVESTGDGEPAPLQGPYSLKQRMSKKASNFHQHVPLIKKLPGRVVSIILVVAAANIAVWIAAGVILVSHHIESCKIISPDS